MSNTLRPFSAVLVDLIGEAQNSEVFFVAKLIRVSPLCEGHEDVLNALKKREKSAAPIFKETIQDSILEVERQRDKAEAQKVEKTGPATDADKTAVVDKLLDGTIGCADCSRPCDSLKKSLAYLRSAVTAKTKAKLSAILADPD